MVSKFKLRSQLTLTCLLISILAPVAAAFPQLSGRVVDDAFMLDRSTEQRLDGLLKGHENATTNQLVVVTQPNLGGLDIETYGYQLGRHWGIGQKGKDNGVLLIVAKQERKIRIEVGYGLEGILTDAISSNIIHTIIRPEFKKANFANGIELGVVAIIEALGGQYEMRKQATASNSRWIWMILFFLIFVLFNYSSSVAPGRSGYRSGSIGGGIGRGGFSGGGGGGFSGGGGGFGGGGASGGW